MTTSDLRGLRNLGPVSVRWLHEIGVRTEQDLRELGAVRAFRLVALAGHRPSLNLAYAIEAALQGVHWADLAPDVRERLQREAASPWNPLDVPPAGR